MTQNANIKPTLLHACALRATRLNADGTPQSGAKKGYLQIRKMVDVQYTMDITTGAVRQVTGGCNDLIVNYREPDIFNRFNLTLNIGQLDPELEELLTGATLSMDTSTVPVPKGINFPAQGQMAPPPVAFEVWADLYENGVFDLAPYRYGRLVLPQSRWRINDNTMQNDSQVEQYIGYTEPNAAWGAGPYTDGNGTVIGAMGGRVWDAQIAAGASAGYLTLP